MPERILSFIKKYIPRVFPGALLLRLKHMGLRTQRPTADRSLIFSLNKSRLPNIGQLKYIKHFLNRRERTTIVTGIAIIGICCAILIAAVYRDHIIVAPAHGGSYTEILTGTPKFINPLYASISTVDSDLVALVYSGLLKRNAAGELTPDLAESFEISEDGRVYTVHLRHNITWHDGSAFSADDVVFTFATITNPEYASPLQRSFSGVTVAKSDDDTVTFVLAEAYAAFPDLLTVGMLPAALWQHIPPQSAHLADLNLKPIGTGPYTFTSLTKDKNGTIRSYELRANKDYRSGEAYLTTLIFKFSPNFQEGVNALNEGRAEGMDYLPRERAEELIAKNSYTQHYLQQPQFSAVFFNQTNLDDLQDLRVRQALAHSLDKSKLVADTQYANVIESPILPLFGDFYTATETRYPYDITQADSLLNAVGWKTTTVTEAEAARVREATAEDAPADVIPAGTWRIKEGKRLSVTLSAVDQDESRALATIIAQAWEALHINVVLVFTPATQMQVDVIKPRAYQALLYGIVLGADPDQYPFWHSSQINANGLNLANYSNAKVDELLEDARITTDSAARKQKYDAFQESIATQIPALFLYSQRYAYLQTNAIQGFNVQVVTVPSDRFSNITDWYLKTKRAFVWRKP